MGGQAVCTSSLISRNLLLRIINIASPSQFLPQEETKETNSQNLYFTMKCYFLTSVLSQGNHDVNCGTRIECRPSIVYFKEKN